MISSVTKWTVTMQEEYWKLGSQKTVWMLLLYMKGTHKQEMFWAIPYEEALLSNKSLKRKSGSENLKNSVKINQFFRRDTNGKKREKSNHLKLFFFYWWLFVQQKQSGETKILRSAHRLSAKDKQRAQFPLVRSQVVWNK